MMTPSDKYDNWMMRLRARKPKGNTRHRIIPVYVDRSLRHRVSNQVFVTSDEHFHIHELLYKRDQTINSFSAWLCVSNIEPHSQPQEIMDELNRRWVVMATGSTGYSYGKHHTPEHLQWLSDLRSGEGNTQYGTTGWTNAWCKAQGNEHVIYAYSLMDKMWDFYIANNHKKRGWGYRAFATSIGWTGAAQTFLNPMRMAQQGDPRHNPEWVAFREEYDAAMPKD